MSVIDRAAREKVLAVTEALLRRGRPIRDFVGAVAAQAGVPKEHALAILEEHNNPKQRRAP